MMKSDTVQLVKSIKSILLQILVISVISYVFYFSGCNNLGDLITPEDQDVTVEAAFMRSTSEIISLCCNVNIYLVLVVNGIDHISGCPTVDVPSTHIFLVSYTPVCISDSIKRSGICTVNYFTNSTADSMTAFISFSGYRVYKTIFSDSDYISITGTDIISTKKIAGNVYQSNFNISNTVTTNTGNSKTINLSLSVPNAVINNTLPLSGTFYITGSGTLNSVNPYISYTYTADPSFPVVYSNICKFPTSGKVYLDYSGNRFTSEYSPNSNCSGVISITKYGIVKYVNLTTVSF